MPVDDAFSKRERFLEEEYFHKREQEFIAAMRHRMAHQGDIKELCAKLGIDDAALAEAILDLGFSGQLSPLLFLAPVVRIAWADGSVSPVERKMIIEMARKDGVSERGMADLLLAAWLDRKPSETFFDDALLAIKAVLLAIQQERSETVKNQILERSKAVAAAPEGLLHRRAEILEPEQRLLDLTEAELSQGFQS